MEFAYTLACHPRYLYMVDGITGCADSIDVGEASYRLVRTGVHLAQVVVGL
jgi:hypothetical protein